MTRHPHQLAEAYIHPICVNLDEAANAAIGALDPNDAVPSARGRTFLGARVVMPDLLGSYLSHHLSVYLCAYEV